MQITPETKCFLLFKYLNIGRNTINVHSEMNYKLFFRY